MFFRKPQKPKQPKQPPPPGPPGPPQRRSHVEDFFDSTSEKRERPVRSHGAKQEPQQPPPPPPTNVIDGEADQSFSDGVMVRVSERDQSNYLDPALQEKAKNLSALCINGARQFDLIQKTLLEFSETERIQIISYAVNDAFTPLMHAAQQNTPQLCQLFLDHGARRSINAQFHNLDGSFANYPGYTALHFACWKHNCVENVFLLCQHGADVNIPEKFGKTPMHLIAAALDEATRNRHPAPHVRPLQEMARILKYCGADLEARTSETQQTPLDIYVDLRVVLEEPSQYTSKLNQPLPVSAVEVNAEMDVKPDAAVEVEVEVEANVDADVEKDLVVEDVKDVEEDVEKLREENERLKSELEQQKGTVEKLQGLIEELETQLAESKLSLPEKPPLVDDSELAQKLARLEEERDALLTDVDPLKDEIAKLKEEKQAEVVKANRAHAEQDMLHQEIADLKEELRIAKEGHGMASLTTGLMAVEKVKKDTGLDDSTAIVAELADARDEVDRLSQAKNHLQDLLRQKTEELDEFEARCSELKSQNEDLQRQMDSVKDLREGDGDAEDTGRDVELQREADELRLSVGTKDEEIAQLNRELRALKVELTDAETAHAEDMRELQAEMKDINAAHQSASRHVLRVLGIDDGVRLEDDMDLINHIRAVGFVKKADVPKVEDLKPVEDFTSCAEVLGVLLGRSCTVRSLEDCMEIADELVQKRRNLESEVLETRAENETLEGKLEAAERKAAALERQRSMLKQTQDELDQTRQQLQEAEEKENQLYDGQIYLLTKFNDEEYDEVGECDLTSIPGDADVDDPDAIEIRADIEPLEFVDEPPSRTVMLRGTRRVRFGGRDKEFFVELAKPLENGLKFQMTNYISAKYVRDVSTNAIYLVVEYFNKAQALEAYQVGLIEFCKASFCKELQKTAKKAGGRPAAQVNRARVPRQGVDVPAAEPARRLREHLPPCDICHKPMHDKFTVKTCNHTYCVDCVKMRAQRDIERNRLPHCAICADTSNASTPIAPSRVATYLTPTQQRLLAAKLKKSGQ